MASAPDVYVVRVGNRDDALIFDPPEIMVGYGGTIQFQFLSVNHSISQSDFANPCAPLPGGFSSGFIFPTDAERAKNLVRRRPIVGRGRREAMSGPEADSRKDIHV